MRRILPIIVISQFFCTSVWFAGNAVIADMIRELQLTPSFLSSLTSAIQFGFITGTLVFAIFTLSDRFSPSRVFFISSILAGLCNLGITIQSVGSGEILLFRFLTGFFLAGIYPVGMKIAADHYQKGLGRSLGFLVGALVIGTALPHLLKTITIDLPWKNVLYSTSILCIAGGILMMLLVPDGPYRKAGQLRKFNSFIRSFSKQHFRSASFGYFGHMWELYSFWAFLPLMLAAYNHQYPDAGLNVSLLSFFIIGSGALACVCSGILSSYFGVRKIASISLFISCCCCLFSPLFLFSASAAVFVGFLFIWGLSVIADSPLFSTLVAQSAPEASKGSSLTIVNCIGFTITIISIQLIQLLSGEIGSRYIYMLLSAGPILGLMALRKTKA